MELRLRFANRTYALCYTS